MKISLNNISKRFQRHWIFQNISTEFETPGSYAILGANGSGKSTFLRIIAGIQNPSVGKVKYHENSNSISRDKIFHHISLCAPAQELVEEFTLTEFLTFHFSFKKPINGLSVSDIIKKTGLESAKHKPLEEYSSGMKQRVKLAQAIFSDTPILLLDEPCSNLDKHGVRQYHEWIDAYGSNRIIIVASNDNKEYSFCRHQLVLSDYTQ